MRFPKFVDLRGVAQSLGNEPQHAKLGDIIRRAGVAQSCAGDLAMASTSCTALDALLASPRKKNTLERAATENALLMNAVMLYARATSNSGQLGERGSIDIRSRLEATELADHLALVEIRNRVHAHVYSRESVSNEVWHAEEFFLVETHQGWKPANATRRIQFHKPTFDRLKRQLPIACAIVEGVFQDRNGQITDLCNSLSIPITVFEENSFDPVKLFGGEAEVERVLAAMSHGSAAGLTAWGPNSG